MAVFIRWLLVLINYLNKDIGDFSNLQMTDLEGVIKMSKSQDQKALKRLKIG